MTSQDQLEIPKGIIPEVWAPIFTSPKTFKIAYGGRDKGASWACGLRMHMRMLSRPNSRGFCVRKYHTSLKATNWDMMYSIAEEYNWLHLTDFVKSDSEIRYANGSKVWFGGAELEPSKMKGLNQVDTTHGEEWADVTRITGTKLYSTVLRKKFPLGPDGLPVDKCEILLSFNPEYEDDHVYEDFIVNQRTDAVLMKGTYLDVLPFINPEMLEHIENVRRNDPEQYEWEFMGGLHLRSDAIVFKRKQPDVLEGRGNWHVEAIPDEHIPDYAMNGVGIDFGEGPKDPSVAVEVLFWDRICYIREEVVRYECPLDSLPGEFSTMKSYRDGIAAVADSARPGMIAFLNSKAVRTDQIRGATKGEGSVKEGIAFLKAFDIVIHPSCTTAIEEFTKHKWIVDPRTGKVGRRGNRNTSSPFEDEWNHIIDAVRYRAEDVVDYYEPIIGAAPGPAGGHRNF